MSSIHKKRITCPRSQTAYSIHEKHQLKILLDTVRNPMKGVFLGGPNANEAEKTLRDKFNYSDAEILKLKTV